MIKKRVHNTKDAAPSPSGTGKIFNFVGAADWQENVLREYIVSNRDFFSENFHSRYRRVWRWHFRGQKNGKMFFQKLDQFWKMPILHFLRLSFFEHSNLAEKILSLKTDPFFKRFNQSRESVTCDPVLVLFGKAILNCP